MSYTKEEIQESVAKFLRSEVRYPVDPTSGVRKTDVSFTDMQEAAASIFVMEPSSVFYVTYLAARSAVGSVRSLSEDVSRLIGDFNSLNRNPPLPLSDLSSLANAAAALMNMEAVTAVAADPKNLSSIPSYALYEQNVDEFLAKIRPSITYAKQVVPTAQDLRASLPAQVAGLSNRLDEVTGKVKSLYSALAEYQALRLPSVLSSNVLTRSRRLVTNRYTELHGKRVQDRQEGLKETALDLLSSKAVLKQLGEFSSPTSAVPMLGAAVGYADASKPCVPARSVSLPNRFNVQSTTNELVFSVNSGAPISVTLPVVSDELFIRGSAYSPFNVHEATVAVIRTTKQAPFVLPGPTNRSLRLIVRAVVGGTLTTGEILINVPPGSYSNGDLAVLITAGVNASLFSGKFQAAVVGGGGVDIQSVDAGYDNYIVVGEGTANDYLGLLANSSASGKEASNVLTVSDGTNSATVSLVTGTRTAEQVVAQLDAFLITTTIPARARVIKVYPVAGAEQQVVEIYSTNLAAGAVLSVSGVRASLGMEGTASRREGLLTVDVLEGALRASAPLMAVLDISIEESGGDRTLVIASRSTVGDSVLLVGGTAQSLIFPTDVSFGITKWLQMTVPSKEVRVGDMLSLNISGMVLDLSPLTAVSDDLIQVEVDNPVSLSLPFVPGGLAWFSISREGNRAFKQLQAQLTSTWLSQDFAPILRELTRYSNAVLADNNPSSAEISTVVAHLTVIRDSLDALLLSLEQYYIRRSLAVDGMVRDYAEKGADRALDILLECRFSDFFGLDVDSSSYAGVLMAGVRTLAREDFPVDRRDRLQGGAERVFAELRDEDSEFEFSGAQVDPGVYVPDEVGSPDTF